MRQGRVLTSAVRGQIEHLVETMQKPTAGKIARRLGLKHGTVYWFMLSRGLLEKKPPSYRQTAYVRNGVTVNPYSPEQDSFILSMCAHGATYDAIARAAIARFGIPRTAHSIHNRIVMLEAVDDEAEAA